MKFLVTGITGFVGPHLANLLLEEGHEVYGLIRHSNGRENELLDVMTVDDLEEMNWVYGDLIDPSSMNSIFEAQQFDGVFHLAAQSHPPTSFKQPIITFNSNVQGSVNLLTAIQAHQKDCHVHFCSTCEVYGNDCKIEGVLKEGMSLHPINPYGVSKAAIDMYMQERILNGFIKGFITRAFSHTGPRRGYTFSISSDAYQIAKMMLGLQENVLLIGNLNTLRIVMDVRDCVKAYYKLMMKRIIGIFNICGDDVYKMQFFTDELIEISKLNKVVQKLHKPFYREIDIQVQVGDTKKLKSVIDWKPEIPIKKTMDDLLQYWVKKLR